MPKPNANSHGNADGYSFGHPDGYCDGNGYNNSYRYSYSYSYTDRDDHSYGDPDGNCVGNAAAYADAEAASNAQAASITVPGTIKAGTRERKLASSPLTRWIGCSKEHAGIESRKGGISIAEKAACDRRGT